MIPNPWVLLGSVVFFIASMLGAFHYGQVTKADSIVAQAARDEKVTQLASDAAAKATAAAIAQIKPKNVLIKQAVEREVRTNTVYVDCKHSPEQVSNINQALTGSPAVDVPTTEKKP